MAQYPFVREEFEPFAIKQVRQAEPYRAEIEGGFINNTNSAWWRNSAAKLSYCWPDPKSAPGAILDTFDSAANINLCPELASPPRCLFTPAWYVGDAVIGIKIDIAVAVDVSRLRRPIRIYSYAREMTGTASTEYGEGDVSMIQGNWSPWTVGRWKSPEASASVIGGWMVQVVTQRMIFTSLPAGRDLKIRFQAKEVGPVDSYAGAFSANENFHVKFAAMGIADILSKPGETY
jgi:hypothetical protein